MRTNYIAIMAILFSSAVPLYAQDDSPANRNVPDADAYSDLLTKGKKPNSNKVEREIPDVRSYEDLLGKGRQSKSKEEGSAKLKAKGPVNDKEIERVLTEAQIRLEEIGSKVPLYEKAAQEVFTKTIGLFQERLKEMRKRKELEDSSKESGEKEGVEAPSGKVGEAEPVVVEEKVGSLKAGEIESPGEKEDRSGNGVLLRHWAEQLRKLADQMVKEADKTVSKNN